MRRWDEAAYAEYLTLDHALPTIQDLQPDGFVAGEGGEAVIPVRRSGTFLVGLGDPAGAQQDCVSAIWRMRDLALQDGLKPVFWQVGKPFLRIYDDIGLSVWPFDDGTGLHFCYPADDIALASKFFATYKGTRADSPAPAGQ